MGDRLPRHAEVEKEFEAQGGPVLGHQDRSKTCNSNWDRKSGDRWSHDGYNELYRER